MHSAPGFPVPLTPHYQEIISCTQLPAPTSGDTPNAESDLSDPTLDFQSLKPKDPQ